MRTIDLSRLDPSRIRFRPSPLFELAASLHRLAQPEAYHDFHHWATNTLDACRREGLDGEWRYFSPLFAVAVPDVFAPHITENACGQEEQYAYLRDLSPHAFAASAKRLLALQALNGDETVFPLMSDLTRHPELVKARFHLFAASYLRLIFAAEWDNLSSAFARELADKPRSLHTAHDVGLFVRTLSPQFSYDALAQTLVIGSSGHLRPRRQIEALALHPSRFWSGEPITIVAGATLHLCYSLTSPSLRE